MKFDDIIRQIAKRNGVSPAEVRCDIQEAVRLGKISANPIAQKHWERLSSAGEEPSVEKVIEYLLSAVVSKM